MNTKKNGARWNSWFHFTKRELIASIFLAVLIAVFLIIPVFQNNENLNNGIPDRFDSLVNLLTDTLPVQGSPKSIPVEQEDTFSLSINDSVVFPEQILRDPNKMRFIDWYLLGLPVRLIRTLQKYREAGGRFYHKSDLKKIYGMNDSIYEAISSWIEISTEPARGKIEKKVIELNASDSLDLIQLPGIGPVLAGRIVKFRNLLGGFYAIDQLNDVYGLPQQTLKNLRQQLIVDTLSIRKINLNHCSEKELSRHPYISTWSARAIMAYLDYKGKIESPGELLEQELLTRQQYNKVRPYLTVK